MKLENAKVAILLCDGFEESEMTRPRDALQQAGATVHLITPYKDTVKAWSHGDWSQDYNVDVKLEEASPEDYDAVMLPGGVINPDKLRTYESAVNFVNHFIKEDKPVAAICHGPLTLVETGKLKGRKVTSFHAIKSDLSNAGAKWQDKEVVVDGFLVTSRQPGDIAAFNEAVIQVVADSKSGVKPKRATAKRKVKAKAGKAKAKGKAVAKKAKAKTTKAKAKVKKAAGKVKAKVKAKAPKGKKRSVKAKKK